MLVKKKHLSLQIKQDNKGLMSFIHFLVYFKIQINCFIDKNNLDNF